MKTYRTSEVAKLIGIHPNTVRLYEKLKLIPEPEREANTYRVFTEQHIDQLRLARLAFKIEVLQNGLRAKVIDIVKTSAAGDYDKALGMKLEYINQIQREITGAEEAIEIVRQLIRGEPSEDTAAMNRKAVSEYLNITMDTLRNWEMNGLLTVKRRENAYRVYSGGDISRIKIIRTLRCANYSLSSILRMLNEVTINPKTDIEKVLDTPRSDEDIISVCDRLRCSLRDAEKNADGIYLMLRDMKYK